MKKTYTKPVVSFESFELSTSIAQTCAVKSNFYDACSFDAPGMGSVFLDTTVCKFTPEDGEAGICYHVPTDTTRLFNS